MTGPSALADLAPSGTLRAAINFDNPILALRHPETGEAGGITVELSRELAKRLNVALEIVPFFAAGKVTEAARSGAWDVCYLAVDPARAEVISFTAPYVVIEGAYAVREASSFAANADVDQPGVRVLVSKGSAYDLFLSRTLKNAGIVRTMTARDAADIFVSEGYDVLAGVRPALVADMRRIAGLRLLPGRFMAIDQAMGTPRGREAGARCLHTFIEELKASGFVAAALARSGVEGASVAPPA